ncbi:MAG: hypothetical protein HWN71_09870 [Desulfobacterales bacterium]|nr:hypothetical protein [Desulfobacterales bacterium]
MLCDNRNAGLDDACKTRAEILGTDPIIETIEVTRMNKGGIELSVFDRYERHRRDLDTSIGKLSLNGASIHMLRGIATEHYHITKVAELLEG